MNKNSIAIVALCSHLCQGSYAPLSNNEWSELALILMEKSIQPEALLDYTEKDFVKNLAISEEYAKRLLGLIGRTASLYFELSKYENMGIGVVTRADSFYPKSIKKSLGNTCPPLFYYAGDISIADMENAQILNNKQDLADLNENNQVAVKYANSLMKEMKKSTAIKAIQKRRLLIMAQKI